MADFAQRHLGARQAEPLTIIDLGSQDIQGSYRHIFDKPPWRYVGADIAPGRNVDLVIKDPYDWRELKTDSVDVLISGQTFEHTEFFWETAEEISRVLKPGGVCCLIAPWTGPVHRYPLDCWRINSDGMLAVARYAGLEVLECWSQLNDLTIYDQNSNLWHESILVARRTSPTKLRSRLFRWAKRNLRRKPTNIACFVQLFYAEKETFREAASVGSLIESGGWKHVRIHLPAHARIRGLRLDFSGPTLRSIELDKLTVSSAERKILGFPRPKSWSEIRLRGDVEKIGSADGILHLKTGGRDPQLYLPPLPENFDQALPLIVDLKAKIGLDGPENSLPS